jgi:hypothetical protein
VGILLILTGMIVLAVGTNRLFSWTDKRRLRRRADAEEYVAAHAVLATTIRQAYADKEIDGRLLKAQLAAADPATDRQAATDAQRAAIDFLDECEELANDLRAAIAYDHRHFKKMPASYQERIVAPHEKWHDVQGGLKALAIQIEELRKQYVH